MYTPSIDDTQVITTRIQRRLRYAAPEYVMTCMYAIEPAIYYQHNVSINGVYFSFLIFVREIL